MKSWRSIKITYTHTARTKIHIYFLYVRRHKIRQWNTRTHMLVHIASVNVLCSVVYDTKITKMEVHN